MCFDILLYKVLFEIGEHVRQKLINGIFTDSYDKVLFHSRTIYFLRSVSERNGFQNTDITAFKIVRKIIII